MKDDEQQILFGSGDVVDVDHAKKFEVPTVDTVPVVHAHLIDPEKEITVKAEKGKIIIE